MRPLSLIHICLLDLEDGLGLALGLLDGGLLGGVGPENHGLLLALGHQDLTLALALGPEHRLALLPLGLHLLLHGALYVRRGLNVLDLYPVDLDAPGRCV